MSTKVKLSLPTSPIEVSEHLSDYSSTIYGRKGIGKTTAAMSLQYAIAAEGEDRKVLNFRFEKGRRNLPILQVPQEPSEKLTWNTFKSYLDQFCSDDSFKMAVADSLDECYLSCFRYVCKNHNVDHPSDAGIEGPAIWDAISGEFTNVLGAVVDCGKSWIFLSHHKTKTIKLGDGTSYDKLSMSCRPSAAGISNQFADFVFHYDYTVKNGKSHRVMSIRDKDNTSEVSCGVDHHFLDPNGDPIYRFAVPDDPKLVGKTILDAFNNKLFDFDFDPDAERKAEEAAERKRKREERRNQKNQE